MFNWLPKVSLWTCGSHDRELYVSENQTPTVRSRSLRLVRGPRQKRAPGRDPGVTAPPVGAAASRDRGAACATGPGRGQPRPFSRLCRPAAGRSGRCFARAPPCARPTASESAHLSPREPAALAGDPPAGPGVSTDVFRTRDLQPGAEAGVLRLPGGPGAPRVPPRPEPRPPTPGLLALNPDLSAFSGLASPSGPEGKLPCTRLGQPLHPF